MEGTLIVEDSGIQTVMFYAVRNFFAGDIWRVVGYQDGEVWVSCFGREGERMALRGIPPEHLRREARDLAEHINGFGKGYGEARLYRS